MKRFLAFLLAFIMMMSALALVSCEEKTDEEEKASEESVEDKESEEESETEELDISVYTPDTVVPIVMTPEFLEERVLKAAEENGCSRTYLARIQVSFKKTKLEEPILGRTELSEEAQARNEARLKRWPMLQKTLEDGTVVNVTLYVLDEKAGTKQKKALEELIKTYCPELTVEVLAEHYRELGYIPQKSENNGNSDTASKSVA